MAVHFSFRDNNRKPLLFFRLNLGKDLLSVRPIAASKARALMTTLTTADQFLEYLRKSQLVKEAILVAFLEAVGASGSRTLSPRQLADRLIADGLLTNFQAR